MPSENFQKDKNYESPIKTAMRSDFQYPSQAEKFGRRTAENYNYSAGVRQFRQDPEEKRMAEKNVKSQLSRLQRNAPTMAANLAKGKKSAFISFAGGLFMKIDWSRDWLFFLLLTFAALKDFFDIAFAAVGAGTSALIAPIPILNVLGAGGLAAIGMTMTFVGNMMFLMLTVTVLVLAGEKLRNRGMAKYILGIAMEFIAEALPGISLLPWTLIYVVILYTCVLYDRKMNAVEAQGAGQTGNNENTVPDYSAADNYNEQLAA